jgi:hypothetical protein
LREESPAAILYTIAFAAAAVVTSLRRDVS